MKYNNNYQILILLPLFFFYTEDIGVDQAFKTDPKKRSHLIANRATNSVLSSFLPEKVCEGKIVLPTHFSKGDTLTPPPPFSRFLCPCIMLIKTYILAKFQICGKWFGKI